MRYACESVPAPIAALIALLPRAARDVRRGRGVALHAPERLVVDPGLRKRVEIAGRCGEAAQLEEVQRLELHVDDSVVPSVREPDRRELEWIADECRRAELTEHVRPDEQVDDAEHAQLRIPEDATGDDRHAGLHRFVGRDRGR